MTSVTQQLRRLPLHISTKHRATLVLLGIWIIVMITVPIQQWIWGEGIVPLAITLGLCTQFIAVLYILYKAWGFRRTFTTFVMVAFLTWLAEFIGSSTGIPFGEYSYTDTLQPQLAHVPLMIPIAWFMMLPPAWAVAQTITRSSRHRKRRRYLLFIGISALAFTAWDLFLDPQMVAWGFWIWEYPGGYFGIPWVNYAGWIVTATIVTFIVRPDNLPIVPLLTVYGVVWFLQSFGQFFFWGQPGPALAGGLAMGILLVSAIRRYRGQTP